MNILCIGDVVGKVGRQALISLLPELKREHLVDFTIVNAENAAGGAGVTPRIAQYLFREGVDTITLGDHVWDRPDLVEYLNEETRIIRPANLPEGSPGKGWFVSKALSGRNICIINLLGRVFMRYNVDCPFRKLEGIIAQAKQEANVVFVDFHAEATSEKMAFGFFADGKVSGVFGTHTHIQTADEKVLPKGTAYITDLGMTGPYDSVIGQDKEKIIQRFITTIPARFEVAKEDVCVNGAVIEVDEQTGAARKITRIQRRIA